MNDDTPPEQNPNNPPPLPPTGKEKRRIERERRRAEKAAIRQRAQERKEAGLPPLQEGEVDLEVKSPVVWVVLLCVPVLFAVLMAFRSDRDQSVRDRMAQKPAERVRVKGLESVSENSRMPRYEEGGTIAPEAPQNNDNAVQTSCNFDPWVGMNVEEDMKQVLTEARRPYRILPPGSMMTMDHSPARVNFEVDGAGTITRVWCG